MTVRLHDPACFVCCMAKGYEEQHDFDEEHAMERATQESFGRTITLHKGGKLYPCFARQVERWFWYWRGDGKTQTPPDHTP